jgi:penicillin-binding protein 1B
VDTLLKKRFKGYGVNTPEAQVALIALDPHTGEIKALVGGRNYGASQLNRVLARRPPGSVFKPFVYTAAMNTAIEDGGAPLTPVSMFMDEPTTFYYDDRTYEPGNFGEKFYGNVTVRTALAKSLNIPTVKVAERVGFANILSLARKAGMTIDAPPTPAIALGSSGVTPLEIAGSYTVFANRGVYVKPNFLLQIRDQNGSPIYEAKVERRNVLDPRVAYLMTNLLEEVMRSGTAAGTRSRGFVVPAAGKTGSSHDAWFAGFTSKLLCVVWVGFDDYRDVKIEGAKAALPIWTEFMKRAHQRREYMRTTAFEAPEGIVSAEIDPESGQLATSACPKFKPDVFIAGTQPVELCRLHGGAGTQVASWETPAPAQNANPVVADADPQRPRGGPARSVQTIPINPTPAPAQPVEPQKRKGFFDRVRGIFK